MISSKKSTAAVHGILFKKKPRQSQRISIRLQLIKNVKKSEVDNEKSGRRSSVINGKSEIDCDAQWRPVLFLFFFFFCFFAVIVTSSSSSVKIIHSHFTPFSDFV
jgi:hypothetical protein